MCIDCEAKHFATEAYKAFLASEGKALVLFATTCEDGTTDINFVSQMEVESSQELLRIAGSNDGMEDYQPREQVRVN